MAKKQAMKMTSDKKLLRPRTILKAGLVVLVLVNFASFIFSSGSASNDELPSWQASSRNDEFNKHDGIKLEEIDAKNEGLIESAIKTMDLAPDQQKVLKDNIKKDHFGICWIKIWDDQSADGDTVSIISDGLTRIVSLTREPQTIAVIRPASNVITITGVADGGGGITAAIESVSGDLYLPIMQIGQTINVKVL